MNSPRFRYPNTSETEGVFLSLFWYFLFYSFLGFVLEVFFAHFAGAEPHRKCLRVLPLCPVYGFGACTIIWAAADAPSLIAIFLIGVLFATAWEYFMALLYENFLGASFWDYSDMPLNIQGRVCLPFSIAWGLLSVPLVRWVHPWVLSLGFAPPGFVTALMMLAFGFDALISCALVMRSGTRKSLDW